MHLKKQWICLTIVSFAFILNFLFLKFFNQFTVIDKDLSYEQAEYEIPVVNNVDKEGVDSRFIYVSNTIYEPGYNQILVCFILFSI